MCSVTREFGLNWLNVRVGPGRHRASWASPVSYSRRSGSKSFYTVEEDHENGTHILQTDKATIKFGGLTAVNELTMDVSQGEIYA